MHDIAAEVPSTRERVLDLVFLLGVLGKGINGLAELFAGAVLLFASPAQVLGLARAVTGEELREDPHDLVANLVLHGAAHLDGSATGFLAAYLLVHGAVKVALVVALLLGSRRVYPWAIAALIAFLLFQGYELIVAPTWGMAALTAIDAAILALTWREYRHGRTLHQTLRGTLAWVLRRHPGDARLNSA